MLRAVRSSRDCASLSRSAAGSWPRRSARRKAASRAGQAGSERARPASVAPRTPATTSVIGADSAVRCADLRTSPDPRGHAPIGWTAAAGSSVAPLKTGTARSRLAYRKASASVGWSRRGGAGRSAVYASIRQAITSAMLRAVASSRRSTTSVSNCRARQPRASASCRARTTAPQAGSDASSCPLSAPSTSSTVRRYPASAVSWAAWL